MKTGKNKWTKQIVENCAHCAPGFYSLSTVIHSMKVYRNCANQAGWGVPE